MTEVTVNWLAILYAVIASIIIGMAWYGMFATPWMNAVGKKKDELQSGQNVGYVVSVITAFITAYVFTHWIAYAGMAYPDYSPMMLGATSGFWAWLAFIGPITAMNTAWEKRSWTLWLINNGNHLLTLIVVGMVIASMM